MAEHRNDPFWKLRPPPPTPEDELCACVDGPPIMLQAHLSPNPLSCIACNSEVPPECVGFPEKLAEELASWQSFHDCFYVLWLDSGAFESWAEAQLDDPASTVHMRGRALVSELNVFRRAYYWWFQRVDETIEPRTSCPVCERHLTEAHGRRICEPCAVVLAV